MSSEAETAMLRAHLGQVSARAAELFADVPSERVRASWADACRILGLTLPAEEVGSQRVALAMLGYRINSALSQTGRSVASMLQANAGVSDTDSRVSLALMEIAAVAPPAAGAAGRAAVAAAGTTEGGVLRRVADSIAVTPAAQTIERIAEAVNVSGRSAEEEQRLLGQVRDLQAGEHGALVAMILSQEKLAEKPTGSSAISPGCLGVWAGLRDIFRWLPGARERAHELEVPDGVDFPALLASVTRGQFSVARLLPSGLAGDRMLRALQAAWPLFMALVEEVLPRDRTAMGMLRRIYVEACAGTGQAEAARGLVTHYFEAMSEAYARFTAGTDSEPPTIEAVHSRLYRTFQQEQMRRHARDESAAQQRSVRERAAAAAERAAAAAERERPASSGAGAPAPSGAPAGAEDGGGRGGGRGRGGGKGGAQ